MAGKSVSTYSFAQVSATLVYPSINGDITVDLTSGGVGEGGIQIESALDTNSMKNGADGSVQHSLRIARPGHMQIEVMRNNFLNSQLAACYNVTTASAASHGFIVVTIVDNVSGETTVASHCACKKLPTNMYKQDAEPIVWEFDVGNVEYIAGLNNGEGD